MTPEKSSKSVDDKFNTMDSSLSPLKVYGILSREETLGVFAFGKDLCAESSMEDLKRRLLTNSCIDTADLILLQNGVKYRNEERVLVAKGTFRKSFKLFAFVRADSIRSTIEFVLNPKSSETIKKVVISPNTRVDELKKTLNVGKLILGGCLMKECALIGDYVLRVANRSNHSRDKRPFQLLALGVPKLADTGDQKTRKVQKQSSSLPTALISKLKPCKIPPIRPERSCTARFKGLQPMRRSVLSRELLRGLVVSSLIQIDTQSVAPTQEACTPVSSPNK